ncbi:C-reactive protein-like [Oryzias melastigma]|uniref:Pentraxin family member n=1 Tax=Oryzias melastigma TaxID=30732 RepID=A0A3B3BBS5_ORYME|nr:C-reactive protein-like [Oryzias melastigma]
MKLLLLLVLLGTATAKVQDLSGKMFTFPQPTNSAQVRMSLANQVYKAVTVCHRSVTDLKRDHAIFSIATPSDDNAYLVFWHNVVQEMQTYVKTTTAAGYREWDYKSNKWHSICTTWDSVTGLGQMWFDGVPSIRKFIRSGEAIIGQPIVILGQEQDKHGGGFDINQSFVGMMSDVHMWDYILSPCEIQNYMENLHFTPGNVLNWNALDFDISGHVLIEDKTVVCQLKNIQVGA